MQNQPWTGYQANKQTALPEKPNHPFWLMHHPMSCWECIEMDDGNYAIPPNNLLRWHNPDFIVPYPMDNPPKVKIFKDAMTSEDIDRSYGNSPYFFYNHYPEQEEQVQDTPEDQKHTPLRSKYIYKEENSESFYSENNLEYPSA